MRSKIENYKNWFHLASRTATSDYERVTFVADLDEMLMSVLTPDRFPLHRYPNYPDEKPTKFTDSFVAGTAMPFYTQLYFDPRAFLWLKKLQDRGHHVMVLTCGKYSFTTVQRIFSRYGVALYNHHFHNQKDITRCGFSPNQKARYIDAHPDIFTERCMLFDDNLDNYPAGSCLFTHVDPFKPFPDLSHLHAFSVMVHIFYPNAGPGIFLEYCALGVEPFHLNHRLGIANHDEVHLLASQFLTHSDVMSKLNAADLLAIFKDQSPVNACSAFLVSKFMDALNKVSPIDQKFISDLSSIHVSSLSPQEKLKRIEKKVSERESSWSVTFFRMIPKGRNFCASLSSTDAGAYLNLMTKILPVLTVPIVASAPAAATYALLS